MIVVAVECGIIAVLERLGMGKVCKFVVSSRNDDATLDDVIRNTFGVVLVMRQTTAGASSRVVVDIKIDAIAIAVIESGRVLVADAKWILIAIGIRVRTVAV